MKAGVIGIISGRTSGYDSFSGKRVQDGTEFRHSFQLDQPSYTESGKEVLTGQAAIHEVEQQTSIQIDDDTGEIIVTEEPHRRGKYTDFVLVPDEFMAVQSGSGTFAFELLSFEHNQISISRNGIDLNAYAERYYTAEGVDPWQVGFYGNVGNAEKGVVYGEDVFSDDEIGEVLERSQLNQLGLQYEESGHLVKTTLSESGYIEIYQPSNYDSVDYAEFILNDLMEFIE